MSSNGNNHRIATNNLSLTTFLNQMQRLSNSIQGLIPCLRNRATSNMAVNNQETAPEEIMILATEEQTMLVFHNELILGNIAAFLKSPEVSHQTSR